MKKPLLALLAVAALAVVAVVIVENTPERRMDRRIDKLLRTYDEPEQFFKRVVDDRDLLGFVLVGSFLKYKGLDRCSCGAGAASFLDHNEDCDYRTTYLKLRELFDDFRPQIEAEFCDCGGFILATPSATFRSDKGEVPSLSNPFVDSLRRKVEFFHRGDCNFARASRDMQKTWWPYIWKKRKEFREAWLNR